MTWLYWLYIAAVFVACVFVVAGLAEYLERRNNRRAIRPKTPPVWFALEISRHPELYVDDTLEQAVRVLTHYSPGAYTYELAALRMELAKRG